MPQGRQPWRCPWLNASLRPIRGANRRGPIKPSVIAAIAGANTAPASEATAVVAVTKANPSMNGSASELSVTPSAATMMIVRRRVDLSIRFPAGVWAMSPTMPAIVMTEPTVASFQPWLGPRTAMR